MMRSFEVPPESSSLFPLVAVRTLLSWAAASHNALQWLITVDIGGTSTRISIGRLLFDTSTLRHSAEFLEPAIKVQPESMSDLLALFTQIGDELREFCGKNGSPLAAVLGVAGPISEGGTIVEMTNWLHTEDRVLDLHDLPACLFPPPERIRLLNDLEASAHGVLALAETNSLPSYFQILFESPPATGHSSPREVSKHISLDAGMSYGVAAMGTGLGVGLIFPTPRGVVRGEGQRLVVSTELGHEDMMMQSDESPHPGDEDERALASYLSKELYVTTPLPPPLFHFARPLLGPSLTYAGAPTTALSLEQVWP